MGANCSAIVYSDDNITEFVWQRMGERCLTPTVMLVTVLIYSTILILGVVGNVMTGIVIVNNIELHNATNYYLFNLAIADLLVLVFGLPFELRSSLTTLYPDIMPQLLCKLRSFISEMTSYASVLTVTAFSIERWLAICFPLKMKMFSTLRRAIRVIVAIWLISFTSAIPVFIYTVNNRLQLPESENETDQVVYEVGSDITDDGFTLKHTDFCSLEQKNLFVQRVLINFAFWTFFLIPILLICVLYAHIIWNIHSVRQKLIGHDMRMQRHDARKLQRRKSVVNMLVAVVIMFFICWSPYHVQRMATLYFEILNLGPDLMQFFNVLFFVSGYFYYANSAINPILYSVLNSRFRKAMCITLQCCVKNADRHRRQFSTRLSRSNEFQLSCRSKLGAPYYVGVGCDSPCQKPRHVSVYTKTSSE